MKNLEQIKKNWFLFGIIFVIFLAKTAPEIGAKGGPIKPEITVKYIAVWTIFFMSGLSQKTEDLQYAFLNVRLHAFIQGFTLLFVPLFVQIIVLILEIFPLDRWLIKGILAVSCMPPPVSSAIILTKAAGGNEAAAIFNSAFGSLLGIFITPTLLLFMLGTETTISITNGVFEMILTVLAPLVFGQMVQRRNREKLYRMRIPYGCISSFILLFIIYTTFCDTFINPSIDIDVEGLTTLILIVIFLQVSLMCITFYLTSVLRIGKFLPGDIVSILFCSTHKSLTLGIPILRIMFHGDKHLSSLCLPLLIYHPVQILLGSLILPFIRKWLTTQRYRVYRLANQV